MGSAGSIEPGYTFMVLSLRGRALAIARRDQKKCTMVHFGHHQPGGWPTYQYFWVQIEWHCTLLTFQRLYIYTYLMRIE